MKKTKVKVLEIKKLTIEEMKQVIGGGSYIIVIIDGVERRIEV